MRWFGFILVVALCVSGFPSARADVMTYCEAFAKSEADHYLPGSAIVGKVGPVNPEDWQKSHDNALADCLAQYGAGPARAAPLDSPKAPSQAVDLGAPPTGANPPAPGSEAWKAYCAAKYASFDPATGMYRSFSGAKRPCVATGAGRIAKPVELR
jgi:hypothetical protein